MEIYQSSDTLTLTIDETTSDQPKTPTNPLSDETRRTSDQPKSPTNSLDDEYQLAEWRRLLCMLPEDVVRKKLENTTHFHLSPCINNRQDPRREFISHRPYRYRPGAHLIATIRGTEISPMGHFLT